MNKVYNSVYTDKKGLFNIKKYNISLCFEKEKITGNAIRIPNESDYIDWDFKNFSVNYGDIINYGKSSFEDIEVLQIDICSQYVANKYYDSYVFPLSTVYDLNEIIADLERHIQDYKAIQEAVKMQREKERNELIQKRKEEERLEQEKKMEIVNFYNDTYNFHIKENTPIYIMNQKPLECFVIYVGDDKSLNFLAIDGEYKREIHSVIQYNEIHYYEKAGAVHYATNINADYIGSQSFGGSFVGARSSVGAAALGGILLGTMGMAIGTLASYKPAEYTAPTYTPSKFNISSETIKIDERNVILNYYSEQKRQYVDIELPQEIFNFLQTFLPEKKYAIVIAKETQNAVQSYETTTQDDIIPRLKKLKELYEMELISESEYSERKKEILAGI